MELEREEIFTRHNIEHYLGFVWGYEKEEEEEKKSNMDKKLNKTKGGKGSISDCHNFY